MFSNSYSNNRPPAETPPETARTLATEIGRAADAGVIPPPTGHKKKGTRLRFASKDRFQLWARMEVLERKYRSHGQGFRQKIAQELNETGWRRPDGSKYTHTSVGNVLFSMGTSSIWKRLKAKENRSAGQTARHGRVTKAVLTEKGVVKADSPEVSVFTKTDRMVLAGLIMSSNLTTPERLRLLRLLWGAR